MPEAITVMILTYNEEDNLARTLNAVRWAERILVVDSGSTDGTRAIVERTIGAERVTRPFDDFASQCNFGLSLISTPWVLSLDADYELSPALGEEIAALDPDEMCAGFCAPFVYCINGRPLRASLYPPRVVLYRRDRAQYHNRGHGHHVQIRGETKNLKAPIRHDDRKPFDRWLGSQRKYAVAESLHLLAKPTAELGWVDRIRRMAWPAPIFIVPYTLIGKRCILDGWPGWIYALQRLLAETLIALEIINRRLDRSHHGPKSGPS